MKKTATRPGRNGGELRIGNPGNKGGTGRPPDEAKAWLMQALHRPAFREKFEAKLDAGDLKAADLALKYTESMPATKHTVDATVVFKAVRE